MMMQRKASSATQRIWRVLSVALVLLLLLPLCADALVMCPLNGAPSGGGGAPTAVAEGVARLDSASSYIPVVGTNGPIALRGQDFSICLSVKNETTQHTAAEGFR
jgi:hypothetical protein